MTLLGERPGATTRAPQSLSLDEFDDAEPAAAAAPSAPAASKFDLASAKIVSNVPVGTTGTAAAVTRYRLEGEEKTITPHLNQQVEINGTVSPATGAAGAAAAAPMLKVESVKMVSAMCQ